MSMAYKKNEIQLNFCKRTGLKRDGKNAKHRERERERSRVRYGWKLINAFYTN